MGGVEAVREAASDAVAEGGIDNWRWGLKQTSLLLALDPDDQAARAARADAARAMGQRTTSANARGFYITEALQIEGGMTVAGQPVTLDLLRRVLGTPRRETLTTAGTAEVLDYLAFLVDPLAAGDQRVAFTLAVEGDPSIHQVLLRNGVLIRSAAAAPGPIHVAATPDEMADFVLAGAALPGGFPELADFGQIFDRSHFLSRENLAATLGSTPTYPY
jgi:alkyl sulfatase BDS1-like metallo-beta-lactamase superfamily hydrolase